MRGEQPAVSIIIAVRHHAGHLRDCLAALAAQEGIEAMEVMVADGTGGKEIEPLCAAHPWARHLTLDSAPLPALKGRAMEASRGAFLAVLDPTAEPGPGWLVALQAGLHESGAAAVGGAVLPDHGAGAATLAAYLFEYGAFTPPLAAGTTGGDLPGNNVAYRREAILEDCADLLGAGFWKPFFHARIRARGGRLAVHPPMVVRQRARYRLGPLVARFFHFGRCFGAMRLERCIQARRRLLYRIFAPGVPLLLALRHLRRALAHPGNRRHLPRAAPALVAICAAWGLGEWMGTWLGSGGSCERVA